MQSFSYLDLVLQDTPLDDESLAESLKQSVYQVDNLSDRDDQKIDRMEARFSRVEQFISYLESEEVQERAEFALATSSSPIAQPIMTQIRDNFEHQRSFISKRIHENREKFAEDVADDLGADFLDERADGERGADGLDGEDS